MNDPTDQPPPQADPDDGYQAVRADLGGWISGPCLSAEELELSGDRRADLGPTWLAERRPGPAQ
jgi:hypothetical protein